MGFLTSNSVRMMEKSMDFLWTKQTVILDNIANAETPNYQPKVVNFEEGFRAKLERAMDAPSPRAAVRDALGESNYIVREQDITTRMDDNGVNVTEQSTEMIRNAYQLQYVMNAINSELNALGAAIRG